MTILRFLSILAVLFLVPTVRGQGTDATFEKLAEEYISGYLAARPLEAVTLGFHEYDGRLGDYGRTSIDAELARLKRFDEKFQKLDSSKLSPRASVDLRL